MAQITANSIFTDNTVGLGPLMGAAIPSGITRQEQRTLMSDGTTLIVRYEKVENGWVVQVAQHEGERYKRYIANTLEDAHKQVSAYIAAERLER